MPAASAPARSPTAQRRATERGPAPRKGLSRLLLLLPAGLGHFLNSRSHRAPEFNTSSGWHFQGTPRRHHRPALSSLGPRSSGRTIPSSRGPHVLYPRADPQVLLLAARGRSRSFQTCPRAFPRPFCGLRPARAQPSIPESIQTAPTALGCPTRFSPSDRIRRKAI